MENGQISYQKVGGTNEEEGRRKDYPRHPW